MSILTMNLNIQDCQMFKQALLSLKVPKSLNEKGQLLELIKDYTKCSNNPFTKVLSLKALEFSDIDDEIF